eukprot:9472985-Pyramimonas_sp.AAC.1
MADKGDGDSAEAGGTDGRRVRAERIDWNEEMTAAAAGGESEATSTYDVVLSSDVVYGEEHPVRP